MKMRELDGAGKSIPEGVRETKVWLQKSWEDRSKREREKWRLKLKGYKRHFTFKFKRKIENLRSGADL